MCEMVEVWSSGSLDEMALWTSNAVFPVKETCPNHNQRRLTPPVFIRKRHSKLITRSQTISNRGGEQQQNIADMNSSVDSQALQSINHRPTDVSSS